MRTALREKPVVFLDCETTGLEDDKHEIIEIAIVGDDTTVHLNTKVKPEHIETASPRALEINGYDEALWADAPAWAEVAPKVLMLLEGVIIVGQNPKFDMGFILAGLKRLGLDTSKISYHVIDTATLAWEHLAPLGLKSLSLAKVRKFLGMSDSFGDLKAHSALGDTMMTREIYYKLLRAGPISRWWWRLRAA